MCVYGQSLSCVRLFATPWTVACPVSLFYRQEYWSGLPFLLQEFFQMQGLNPSLLHWQMYSLAMSHLGRQKICPSGTLISLN